MTTVLIADDEREIRNLLASCLISAGYSVIEAGDGHAALEKACREYPDLILLHLIMPVMDGFDVLRRLRGMSFDDPIAASIPVVLLTGLSPADGERTALSLGANHYLTKPWEPGMVEAAVSIALREVETFGNGLAEGTPLGDPESNKIVPSEDALFEQALGSAYSGGSLTMIEGTSSSGKSVLCQHRAYQALQEGQGVAYFTSEYSARELVAQMDSLGLMVSEYYRSRQLRIHPLDGRTPQDAPERRLGILAKDIARLPGKYECIVIDSITMLASYSSDLAVTDFATSCKHLCEDGRTITLSAHSHMFNEKTIDRLEVLCDTHINLRAEGIGGKVWKIIEARKVRDTELTSGNMASFEVVPGMGMHIVPFRRVRV